VTGVGKIFARQCDLNDEEQLASAFNWIREKFQAIHVLICNAGILKANFLSGKCSVKNLNFRDYIPQFRIPHQGHQGTVRHKCGGHRQLPAGGTETHGCGQGSRSHCGHEQVSVHHGQKYIPQGWNVLLNFKRLNERNILYISY